MTTFQNANTGRSGVSCRGMSAHPHKCRSFVKIFTWFVKQSGKSRTLVSCYKRCKSNFNIHIVRMPTMWKSCIAVWLSFGVQLSFGVHKMYALPNGVSMVVAVVVFIVVVDVIALVVVVVVVSSSRMQTFPMNSKNRWGKWHRTARICHRENGIAFGAINSETFHLIYLYCASERILIWSGLIRGDAVILQWTSLFLDNTVRWQEFTANRLNIMHTAIHTHTFSQADGVCVCVCVQSAHGTMHEMQDNRNNLQ